jgi:ADP-ribose pyrophosphatase YjhB (NUDIX family)
MPTLSATITGGGTDYPVRGTISPSDFAKGLAQMGESIEYSNFKSAVAKQMGKSRAALYHEVWSTLQGIEDEPSGLSLALKPGVKYSFGGVLVRDGKVLLREPKSHFDGYVWTFPKGCPDRGETPEQTALREVREETGVVARIERLIPGEFKGGTGMTIFYLMSVVEDTGKLENETLSVKWATPGEALKLITMTTNPIGRKRDLAVLDAVAL